MTYNRFFLWGIISLLLQYFWYDNIGHMWAYTPHFILFILLFFPEKHKGILYLLTAFASGLLIDALQFSGGIYTATSLTLALILHYLYRIWQHQSNRNIDFIRLPSGKLTLVLLAASLLFELLLYWFDSFSFSYVWQEKTSIFLQSISDSFFLLIFVFLLIKQPENA